jgi:hypothetical protein
MLTSEQRGDLLTIASLPDSFLTPRAKDAIRAALEIAEHYARARVPREPTQDMLQAAHDYSKVKWPGQLIMRGQWRAMYDAAPPAADADRRDANLRRIIPTIRAWTFRTDWPTLYPHVREMIDDAMQEGK